MKITEAGLEGAFILDIDPIADKRGFFARSFCAREMAEFGMNTSVVQSNISYSAKAGTLRGMHYQAEPAQETKLIRCTRGSIVDVIVDARENSVTYLQHVSVELTSSNHRALFVPEGFAHGFQTLEDDTEVFYLVSGYYTPECERGLHYDDPVIGLSWPRDVAHISEKDSQWPFI